MIKQERFFRFFRFCLVGVTVAAIDFGTGLAFKWPDTAFGRSFNCILYCGLLPFPAEQNVGVPVPAKRLYPATHAILHGRRCQLVDDDHDRPSLPVDASRTNVLIAKLFAVPPATLVAFLLMQFFVFRKSHIKRPETTSA